MIRAACAIGLAACTVGSLPTPAYHAPHAPAHWCRLAAGAYAYAWMPSTEPALAGDHCDARLRARAGRLPMSSTLAELVVEPGAAIELPVELPPALRGMGCVLDRVVIAHTARDADLGIAVRTGDQLTPIVTYAAMPATFGAPVGGWRTDPPPIALHAIHHRIGMTAPDRFAIVLDAGAVPFGIGVRSDRESRDPPLRYRAPGAAAASATHQVPQAAVVLTRCRRPASAVLGAIE